MFLADLLFALMGKFRRGVCRALNVKRSAPAENHTATEYADALLFGEDDPVTSDSLPPSILDSNRR